ncbi:MAG: M56 family metallopeptidase [Thermoguttaceae bacterium]
MIGSRLWLVAGWTMLHYFWIGAVFGAALLLVRWRLRTADVAVRYAAALVGFVLLCAIPAGIVLWVARSLPSDSAAAVLVQDGADSSERTDGRAVGSPGVGSQTSGVSSPVVAVIGRKNPEKPAQVGASMLQNAAARLPWLWLLGSPLTFALTALGLIGAERLRRGSRLLSDGCTAETCRSLAATMRISRCVGVAVCDRVASPILLGIVRPMIVLPAASLAGWTPEQLEMVLLHELAHVRRCDNLVNLLQRVAESVLFFQPMVWAVSAWVRREREHCCDAAVVARTGRPCDYAQMLVAMADTFFKTRKPLHETPTHSSVSTVASSLIERPLIDRVRHILGQREEPAMRVSNKTFGLTIALAMFLAAVLGRYALQSRAEDAARQLESERTRDAISGVVVDRQGNAATNATVRALPYGETPLPTTTHSDGTFSIELSKPVCRGAMFVAANADGSQQALVLAVGSPTPKTPIRLTLQPSRQYDVEVVDAAEKPVAGVAVELAASCGRLAAASTDSHGKATLRAPKDAKQLSLWAQKPGLGADYWTDVENNNDRSASSKTIRLKLDGDAPVTVDLFDSAGQPVPATTVRLDRLKKRGKPTLVFFGWPQPGEVSDAKGRATFEGLPAELDRVEFYVNGDGYTSPQPAQFRIDDGGNPRHLAIRLFRQSSLSGRVTYPDGKPAQGIVVQIEGMGKPAYFRDWTYTAADGTYQFKAPPNHSCLIAVVDDRWAAKTLSGVILKEGDRHDRLDLRLQCGTVICGRVTVGPDRKPIDMEKWKYQPPLLLQLGPELPKEWKWRFQSRVTLARWGQFDADGRYAFLVGPGEYQLVLPTDDRDKPRTIAVADQKEIVVDQWIPKELPQTLRGRVVDRSQKPVAGAVVAFPNNDHVTTGRDGCFIADFGNAGDYRIFARHSGRNLSGSTAISKEDAETTIVMDTAATVAGRVADAQDRSLPGVRLHFDFFSRPPNPHGWFPIDAETDRDGKYLFAGLPVGFEARDVRVSWFNPTTQRWEVSSGPKLTVQPGENHLPDVHLTPLDEKYDAPDIMRVPR